VIEIEKYCTLSTDQTTEKFGSDGTESSLRTNTDTNRDIA